ncbi:MAG: sigma 54-interacting transcriptional regulator [Polyangiaceae bacterium]|nr:sigma 54-interacting transcriptional regulator [Polyangiaceae bacterium]
MVPPGAVLQNRYTVVRALGEGGMGTSYLVRDEVREVDVALKLLRVLEPEALDALRAEFVTLRGLSHPHLCQVHDFGRIRGEGGGWACFYTAELVEGVALDRYAAGRPWAEVGGALAGAIEALGFLHRLGVRHGDFKPENVLVEPSGRAVLIDLGCSGPLERPAGLGEVSGTPGFLAPELLRGEAADRRADLYALGITLARLAEVMGELPAGVEGLRRRLVREAPGERPVDVEEVLEELSAAAGGRRARGWAGTVTGAGAVTGAAWVEPPRLLGRRNEMEAFERVLDDLIAGRPGTRGVVLHGPEGAGRSRLLREMKWAAELRCAVVEGRAGGAAPLTSVLRRAAGDAALPGNVAGLLRARERLAAAEEPTAIFLDDLHLLPEAERDLALAVLRSLEPGDRFLIVATQPAPPPPLGAAAAAVPVPPLDERDVAAWAGPAVDRRRAAELHRLTGGAPGAVRQMLLRLSGAEGAERDLDALAASARASDALAARARALSPEERRALGLVAVLEGELDPAAAAELSADREALGRLAQGGWVVPDGGGWRLARLGEAGAILDALGPEVSCALHGLAAARERARLPGLTGAAASACAARLVVHLCGAGGGAPAADAEAVACASRALFRLHPEGWPRAAAALAQSRSSAEGAEARLLAAEIHDAAGQPREALRLVAAVVRRRPPREALGRAWLRAGASYLKVGDARRALRYLGRAAAVDALRPEALEAMSRAHIAAGAYAEALELARRALAEVDRTGVEPRSELLGHLHDDLGVAASYLGDTLAARAHLREAAALHEAAGDGRGVARAAACEAINELRSGDAAAAVVGARHALEAAERGGTSYQIASAALNLGTACHQEGDLGEALAAYERALAMAIALGKRSTEATLEHNLARLHADAGLLERAEAAARRAAERARAAGLLLIAASAVDLEGEAVLARGDAARALRCFDQARSELAAQAASREVAEVDLHRADARIALGDAAAAREAIEAARAASAGLGAPDVAARVELAAARLHLAGGAAEAVPEAIACLERAQRLARAAGQRPLRAEVEAALAAAHARRGDQRAAEQHRARARGLWETVHASLPPRLAGAFWRHPLRAPLRPEEDAPERPAAAPSEARRPAGITDVARHARDINRKLSACARTEEVLSLTMDSAIELTGAERGFVILAKQSRHEPELEVAVARNIDREDIHRSHLKFSKGIADRVVLTGEVVVCHDAQVDERFSANRSVHAMRLRSIVCVPIRGRSGVLGALYLDHRYERGRFGEGDSEILTAFADQVAIALQSARLRELEERAGTGTGTGAATGSATGSESESAPAARAPRHDYGSIIGRSATMQSVFSVLDRVIDASVSILIQGESGTGKELVARALHDLGPRRGGPFLAVDCGAAGGEGLLESELFGHVRGAFTGAVADRVGLFEAASGGTLLLDEIGEMPAGMQVKLLRALQQREVRRLGSSRVIPVDIRLVCATNRVLRDEVLAGRFRKDLFYRVGVVEVTLPPLRERAEDIPALAAHLLARVAAAEGRPPRRLTDDALRALRAHPFPGNVRELENVLTKAALLAEGDRITARDLSLPPAAGPSAPPPGPGGRAAHEAEEAARMLAALRDTGWNASEACRRLGMPRATFYRKLKRYGFEVGRPPGPRLAR